MANKRNLLLIENQIVQFETIYDSLGAFNVFPPKDDRSYFAVMDRVRIWLTKHYSEARKKEAFTYLCNYIRDNSIELYIIDLMLVGTYDGDNGITLATKLQEKKELGVNPVIFLSGSPKHTADIEKQLEVVNKYEWVEKGYAGVSLNEIPYLKNNLVPVIERLLGAGRFEIISGNLDQIICHEVFEDYRDFFEQMKSEALASGSYSSAAETLITDLASMCHGNWAIKQKINAYRKKGH